MTTKPLPPHGSQARYKGTKNRPPCHCRRCVTGWTQAGQRRQLLRLAGKPATLGATEVEAVTAHLKACLESGMSQGLIARRANVAQSTIGRILQREGAGCYRGPGERILSVRPGDFDEKAPRPALATVRRIRALYYAGHGPLAIQPHAAVSLSMITELAGGDYQNVTAATEVGIIRACAALAHSAGTYKAAAARARREGWAPLSAWDDETLNDADATADWTGHCGTDHGFWTHRLQKIPMCQPCDQAHVDWKTAHAHLEPRARVAAAHRARCAASNRGLELAEDGRELLRLGCSPDQAAERLGVTRQHLQQELCRHPETARKAA